MSAAPAGSTQPAERPGRGDPLSVVIVTHDSAAQLRRSLPPLVAELRDDDELIVCDNDSRDQTPATLAELAPKATVLEPGENLGFGDACNLAAERAARSLLVFLNPDAEVQPGWREAISLPLADERCWDAWQALITADGGRTVNTWGGVVHFTGIAWAGGAGRPVAEAPTEPREVAFASGACLAITRRAWELTGGFAPGYFLYHEDVDLGLRLWQAGLRVGVEPRARVDHAYEFHKGPHKWRYLERNRWATIVRTYPAALLALLAPALLATELALLAVAARGGWLGAKLRGAWDALRWTPTLFGQRTRVRSARAGGAQPGTELDRRSADGALVARLSAELDSPFLGRAGSSGLLDAALRGYWRLVLRLLGFERHSRGPG